MYSFFKKYGDTLQPKERLTQEEVDDINEKNIGFVMHNTPEYVEFYNSAINFYRAMQEAKARGNTEELRSMQRFMERNLQTFNQAPRSEDSDEDDDNNNRPLQG